MNEDVLMTEQEFFEDPITKEPRVLSDGETARNFTACIFIFIMQMTMICYTFEYFSQVYEQLKNDDPILSIYIIRLICALALHMMIEPEVF
jgi:hypothetical protein